MFAKRNLLIILLNLCSLAILPASSSNKNLSQNITKKFTQLQGVYTVKRTPLNAQAIKTIEKNIGYTFKEKKHLKKALTTKSISPKENMEIYEYNGDVILKHIDMLLVHKKFPKASPGERTNLKDAMESLAPLCALGVRLELHKYILHINKEIKSSVIEDAMEALIGAIYEDGGPQASKQFVIRFIYPMIANHKVMPTKLCTIIRKAHPNKCMHYTNTKKSLTNITCDLEIIEPKIEKLNDGSKKRITVYADDFSLKTSKKTNPKPRIATYNACYQYILNNLSAEQQKQLISWPLSDNYMEYNDTLDLKIDWQKILENPQLRLHNLCAKIKTDFNAEEQSDDNGFLSTVEVNAPFNITQSETGKNKKEARKKAAQKVLGIMQQRIILHPQLHPLNMFDLAQTLVENTSSHKAMLNRVCKKHNLEVPQTRTRVQENLISEPIAFITKVNAPWLIKSFETNAYPTAKEAQRAAHKLTLNKIIKYLKSTHNNTCDLKKLTLLKYVQGAQSNQNKTKRKLLNELKEKADLKLTYHDYRVSDENYQLKHRSTIVMDQHTIKGNPQVSLASAQEDAATKALNRLVANMKLSLLNPPKEQPKDKKNTKKTTVATSKKLLSLNCSSSSTCSQSSTSSNQKNDSSKKIALQQTYINKNKATDSAQNKKSNTKKALTQQSKKPTHNQQQKTYTNKNKATNSAQNKRLKNIRCRNRRK